MGFLQRLFRSPFFIFSVLALICFWPLSLQLLTFKNDALTYYYPVRVLISDALHNGQLPLWTPFVNLGYPLHADMQSGAWSPVIWLIAILTNYSLYAFHLEFIFHIALAGTGFYLLAKDYGCSRNVALMAGVCYQFSGFMIDSAQFYTCITSAAYLPFVFLHLRKVLWQHPKNTDALLLSFWLYIFITSGYPSLFIITAYLLFIYLVYSFATSKVLRAQWMPIFKKLLIATLIFIALALPAALSFYYHLAEIKRGAGQSMAFVMENPMNPSNIVSLISPFAVLAPDSWLDTSILMRNIYIGLVPFVFLLAALVVKYFRGKDFLFSLSMFVLMLAASFGSYGFVRAFLFNYVPLMDSFRHPGVFRLFAIFFMLVIAMQALQRFIEFKKETKVLKNIILSVALISLLVLLISAAVSGPSFGRQGMNAVAWHAALSFSSRYLVQLVFVAIFLWLIYRWVIKEKSVQYLWLLVVADMIVAAQFNLPTTVLGATRFANAQKIINRNAQSFPLPENISLASMASGSENEMTGSSLPMQKKMSRNDYYFTPGNLILQDSFYASSIRPMAFALPAFYLAANDDTAAIAGFIPASPGGTAYVVKLSANEIELIVKCSSASWLIAQQNYYPGWRAFVDKEEKRIEKKNITEMAVQLAPGTHQVIFSYEPAYLRWAVPLSFASLTGILLILAFSRYQSWKHQKEVI